MILARTSADNIPPQDLMVTVQKGEGGISLPLRTVSLAHLSGADGIVVVTAKSYANPKIAARLGNLVQDPPIVILQNGINVERAYLEIAFPEVYRCVLYATAQKVGDAYFSYRPVTSSPVGLVRGNEDMLHQTVETLHTEGFPFHVQPDIQTEVWKKAIINAVFNSVCPLLGADNGIFWRNTGATQLAGEIVHECLEVARRLGLELDEEKIMEQLLSISRKSDGQLISTLQDINHRRETEIESLNLEISRIAEGLRTPSPFRRPSCWARWSC